MDAVQPEPDTPSDPPVNVPGSASDPFVDQQVEGNVLLGGLSLLLQLPKLADIVVQFILARSYR
jgi:hypothetical protein